MTFPTLHTSWVFNILVLWSFRARNPCRSITTLSFVVFSTWFLLLVTLWTLVWISISLFSTQLILSLLIIAHKLPLSFSWFKILISPIGAFEAIYSRCGWSPPTFHLQAEHLIGVSHVFALLALFPWKLHKNIAWRVARTSSQSQCLSHCSVRNPEIQSA